MALTQTQRKGGLAAIVGSAAAAALLIFTPAKEGTILQTYKDIGGVLTYCTGATENAQWGKTYTPDECRAQLDRDLERHAAGIAKCVDMEKLTPGQRVAYTDFAFNNGVAAFCGSTAARKANAGDKPGSCAALKAWVCVTTPKMHGDLVGPCVSNAVDKRFVQGLANRRQAEYDICMKDAL